MFHQIFAHSLYKRDQNPNELSKWTLISGEISIPFKNSIKKHQQQKDKEDEILQMVLSGS